MLDKKISNFNLLNFANTDITNDRIPIVDVDEASNDDKNKYTTLDEIRKNLVQSNISGITGADVISNIISLTPLEFLAITPNASTFYLVTDSMVHRLYLGSTLLMSSPQQSPLDMLSMRSDLLIFQPKNAIGDDLVITDEVGGTVTFSQTDVDKRPTINGNTFQTGDTRAEAKGLVSSSGFTFKEIFIVCDFAGGLSVFENNPTLFSGTGTTGADRIMGIDASADLIESSSVNDSGLVRLNQAVESATILPIENLTVLHSASDFTTPADITDASNWTIGYNSQVPTARGWSGGSAGQYSNIGTFIFSTIALTNAQRLEINIALRNNHEI